MEPAIHKKVQLPFEQALEKITTELKKEGFGVITVIDMKQTLQNKIGVNFRNYVILGACNPNFAHQALCAEDKAGIFLPCNVVVQQHENGEVEISVVNPEEMLSHVGNPTLSVLARQVKKSLEHVLANMD